MALKIVTGGTTGAADGTLVSSSNKITFTAIDAVVNAHMRCDDDTYSADETFTLPSDGSVQVSFDGGSTWYGSADSPRSVGVDIGDLNVAIKLRQHATTASASGSFSTDGSFVAASALSNVSGFTVTPGDAQNALSWGAVTNRTSYQVDRATDSGFTTGVTLGIYTGTGTSFTDTGLTNGTTYYYRIKAVGTVRYKDSASYATGNGAPVAAPLRTDLFTGTDGTSIASHTPDGGGTWSTVFASGGTGPDLRIKSNRVLPTISSGAPTSTTVQSWLSGSSNADCAAEVDAYVYSVTGSSVMVGCRVTGANTSVAYLYRAVLADDGTLTLSKIVNGSYTVLGTYSAGTLTVGSTYTVRVEAIGTAIKAYINGVQRISVTDSSVTAGGGLALFVSNPTANTYSSAGTGMAADAVRLYNT